jgi:hypothetical protein
MMGSCVGKLISGTNWSKHIKTHPNDIPGEGNNFYKCIGEDC